MHLLIIVAAFAFMALTPYLHALPRSSDDSAQAIEQVDVADADEDSDQEA